MATDISHFGFVFHVADSIVAALLDLTYPVVAFATHSQGRIANGFRPDNAKMCISTCFHTIFCSGHLSLMHMIKSDIDIGFHATARRKCHEIALKLVSGTDFWWKLLSGAGPVDLKGSRGGLGPKTQENSPKPKT